MTITAQNFAGGSKLLCSDRHLDRSRRVLQKNTKFNAVFTRVGDYWEVPDDIFSDAGELPCALYGKPGFKTATELRFQLLKAKCGNEDKITNNTNVDITNMPPCGDSLRENV